MRTMGPLGVYYDEHCADIIAAVDWHTFADAFNAARDESPRIAESTSPFDATRDEIGTAWCLTVDGRSGYAVRSDGELVYVFSTVRGRGDHLVAKACYTGATNLDCFDGYLVDLYSSHGFHETRREENWTPGGPDVVYMGR